jgi:hypothetical protein
MAAAMAAVADFSTADYADLRRSKWELLILIIRVIGG